MIKIELSNITPEESKLFENAIKAADVEMIQSVNTEETQGGYAFRISAKGNNRRAEYRAIQYALNEQIIAETKKLKDASAQRAKTHAYLISEAIGARHMSTKEKGKPPLTLTEEQQFHNEKWEWVNKYMGTGLDHPADVIRSKARKMGTSYDPSKRFGY